MTCHSEPQSLRQHNLFRSLSLFEQALTSNDQNDSRPGPKVAA